MKKKRVYKILCGIMTAMASIGSAETQKQQDTIDGFSSCPPLGGRDKGEGEDKPEEEAEIPSSVGEPTASPQGEAEEEETVILRTQSEESHEQDSADYGEGDSLPSAQNDGFSSCPPLGGRDKGEGEEKPEEEAEIPSSVGEPTASPQGEAEEGGTVILRTQSEESHEQEPADYVEGDSSPSAQNDEERTAQNDGGSTAENDVFSPCPPLGGRDKGEGEEVPEEEAEIPSSVGEPTASPQGEAEEEEIDLRTPTAGGLCFERREGTQSYAVTGLAEDGKEATRVIVPKELFGCPVTEIGEGAFRGCRSLQEVIIPEGVTKIGDRAFYGCYALERIELPDSLKSVGDEVFYLCMAITSQTEYDNAYYIGNRRNPYVLLSIHKAGDISSCAVHRATKFIDRGAFAECRTLTDIEIPNGVLGIGSKAFYNCSALERVSFGSGLVRIGESAFYGCTALHGAKFSGAREAWERIEIEEENEPLFPPVFLS